MDLKTEFLFLHPFHPEQLTLYINSNDPFSTQIPTYPGDYSVDRRYFTLGNNISLG
ncbi:hypothetical protein PL9214290938 [Planktothrix tepida PCC 9214]|uniref:Uncharacterized protein n=1 Tax=Planktothrix tepida PCC 9214 TaxID=671072 RepID=A0A1J1LFI8_9CYAN|nr:hypothetical protein PL9214290938 [Planktothrix tepida PCC 9214]